MEVLKAAVREYASRQANGDGLALTPVPGLRMMFVERPRGDLHSIYRPLVCMILQGAKRMVVGTQEQVFVAGQSVVVTADMPVTGRIIQADRMAPYMAVAVEFDNPILTEVALHRETAIGKTVPKSRTLFVQDTDAAVLDCAMRLLRLLDSPDAIPVLRPGIMRELHYWLLSGRHGAALRALALPNSHASRLSRAIAELRANYREQVSPERLAATAAMGLTTFHKRFKRMMSLTPGQFQKRLRLIEARRLMLNEGFGAGRAAFDVGYKSVSQFTREYGLLFGNSPKRHSSRTVERFLLPPGQATQESADL